jgi:integrase
MASIQKRTQKGDYYAFFRDEQGRRACRSTATKDKAAAMALALKWERAASEATKGTLTVGKARLVLNEMLSLTGQAIDQESTRIFAKRWMDGKKARKSARTAERYGPIITRFLGALGPKADQPLAGILPADIERHRDALAGTGKSALSVLLELKTISAMLSQALRQGLISSNPVASVELDEGSASTKEPFTPANVAKLLTASTGTPWHGAILIAALTGLRLGDVSQLKWSTLDLSQAGQETLTITPQKTKRTGKKMILPLHPAIVSHLAEMEVSDDPEALVFPTLALPTGGAKGLSALFTKVMNAAGIDRTLTEAAGLGRRVSNKSFHSLRHYTATELLNAGIDEALRMKLLGHSKATTNRGYSHAAIATLRQAVGKLKIGAGQ